ncbi:hypothetical protein PMAYCL1PPCAC_24769, partial [Pristionchus mayeri]
SCENSEWTVATLTCGQDKRGAWRCETDLEFIIHHQTTPFSSKHKMSFNNSKSVLVASNGIHTNGFVTPAQGYIINDKIIFEFRIIIISSEIPPISDPSKFSSNGM